MPLTTQLEEVDKAISDFLPRFECTLNNIPGVNDITVAKLLSEIKIANLDPHLQTAGQHHLWDVEEQDGVSDAGIKKNIITYIVYRKTDCANGKNMIK